MSHDWFPVDRNTAIDRNTGRQARGQRAHRPTTAQVSFPQLSFQFSFSNFKFQMVPANGSPGPTPPTNTLPPLDRSPQLHRPSPCLVANFQIPIFFPASAWRLKSRRNKKYIVTAVCKWRDESNEPNIRFTTHLCKKFCK